MHTSAQSSLVSDMCVCVCWVHAKATQWWILTYVFWHTFPNVIDGVFWLIPRESANSFSMTAVLWSAAVRSAQALYLWPSADTLQRTEKSIGGQCGTCFTLRHRCVGVWTIVWSNCCSFFRPHYIMDTKSNNFLSFSLQGIWLTCPSCSIIIILHYFSLSEYVKHKGKGFKE